MLFDPARHEPLCATPWNEAAARAAIAAIVDDIGRQFEPRTLWPSHPRARRRCRRCCARPANWSGLPAR